MNDRPPPQSRLNNNGVIKFASDQPGGGTNGAESASTKTFSEKSVHAANVETQEKSLEESHRHGRASVNSTPPLGRPAQHDVGQARSARTPLRTIPGARASLYCKSDTNQLHSVGPVRRGRWSNYGTCFWLLPTEFPQFSFRGPTQP